jgi:hypothetical protein
MLAGRLDASDPVEALILDRMDVTDGLSQRGLNRATLARQYLLERAPARAIDAIEHLGGMQSQAPLAPYVGLWTRLQDFAADELSALTAERQVVRLHLMRNTVHLVSARDALDWRALCHRGASGAPTVPRYGHRWRAGWPRRCVRCP